MRAGVRGAVPTAAALLILALQGCDTGDSRVLALARQLSGADAAEPKVEAAAQRESLAPPGAEAEVELIEGDEVSSYPETETEAGAEEPLYGYVDAGGSMRMVRGLSRVPPEYRDRARDLSAVARFNRVEMPAPRAPRRLANVRPEFNANRFDAVLYSSESCGYCARTRSLLDSLGVSYELRDIQRDPGARDEVRSVLGRVSVPLLGVDGAWVAGYKPDAIKRVLGLDG
jgi:glutaredoxin